MKIQALCAVGAIAIVASSASASLRITEAMSSSGSGGTADWFEVTNYGSSAVDITGYTMDDNSYSFANSVLLSGITSIGAGETVIFVEGAAGDVAGFRSFWGGLSGVNIGYYSGSGVSFSSNGDGVVLFNASGAEATARASFGAATSGSSFYFDLASDTGIVSTVGTIGTQVTFATTGSTVNIGSLGTAIGVPGPGALALLGVAGLAARRRR
ncbi:MAG: lamin tail domain-containing protein [Phycisphaerales bacterium]